MFKCAVTGEVTEPREPQTKVVVQTRAKQYVNEVWDEETGKRIVIHSQGHEIVKEINVSPKGMAILENRVKDDLR